MSRLRPLPLVTAILVLACVLGYLAELAGGGMAGCNHLGLVPARLVRTGDVAPIPPASVRPTGS